jgi:hypothetical protein
MKGPYTSLAGHARDKSRLVSPINSLRRLQMIDWFRDLLPEHLWIDLLAGRFGESGYLSMFNRLLDKLQEAAGEEPIFHGYISEFALFPEDKRAAFMEANADLVKEAFFEPAGRFLTGYPAFPAAWLCAPFIGNAKPPDVEEIADVLTRSVTRLAPGKNVYVGHLRILPFSRKVRAKKFSVAAGSPHLDLMARYPAECSDDEKRRVQQFAAMTMNATMSDQYANFPWAALFWRHNHQIVACHPLGFTMSAGAFLDEAETERLLEVSGRNAEKAFNYLKPLGDTYKCDLFAPERDEILLGLFTRLTRLFFKMCTDSSLWAQDMAGILLRCLVETGIVFAYLSRKGTPEEFAAFRSYGEGKQKLLMLHLQDTYSGSQSLQGKSPAEIARSVSDGASPEFVNIELDNWTKKSARDLALAAGFEKYYRLVYDPSSADVHGTWMSLDQSNLTRCSQPLHRFHRLPGVFEPPAYSCFVRVAHDLYSECLKIGIETLGFPPFAEAYEDLPSPSPESDA